MNECLQTNLKHNWHFKHKSDIGFISQRVPVRSVHICISNSIENDKTLHLVGVANTQHFRMLISASSLTLGTMN